MISTFLITVITCFILLTEPIVDWNPPAIGSFRKDGLKSEAKGDFAISLEAMVEAGSNTGYLAQV